MKLRADGGYEKGRRNLIFAKETKDARESNARSVVTSGKLLRRNIPGIEAVGFGVDVER
jgi:hypothetical protein